MKYIAPSILTFLRICAHAQQYTTALLFRRQIYTGSFLTCSISNNIDGSEDTLTEILFLDQMKMKVRCDNEEDLFAELEDKVGDMASFSEHEELQLKLELPVQIYFCLVLAKYVIARYNLFFPTTAHWESLRIPAIK